MTRGQGITCRLCGARCCCKGAAAGICCGCHSHTAHKRRTGSPGGALAVGGPSQISFGDVVLETVDGRGMFDLGAWEEVR